MLDDLIYLQGEYEECGVSVLCRKCWDGGRPVVYYGHVDDRSYRDDPKVGNVSTVSALIDAVHRHVATHEG